MEKYSKLCDHPILKYLDYLTIFQLKYTNKRFCNLIKEKEIDLTCDLRNTKYNSKISLIKMRIIQYIKY